MPRRFCIETTDGTVCGTVFEGPTQRCPPHQAAATQRRNARTNTTARGYGAAHQAERARLLAAFQDSHAPAAANPSPPRTTPTSATPTTAADTAGSNTGAATAAQAKGRANDDDMRQRQWHARGQHAGGHAQ